MNRLLAGLAFVVFLGFVGILVFKVPSPDLIVIAILTTALVCYDLITSSGRKG
jgi:energy-converting hydrogenase Eha subunit C